MTADGSGVLALAGSAAVRLLADRVGLTGQLSRALTRHSFVTAHDRGQVLVDMAAVPVAGVRRSATSTRCVTNRLGVRWRHRQRFAALKTVSPAASSRVATARARVRRQVWSQLPGDLRASRVAGTDLGETVVIDVDATLVRVHSEKEQAAANYKGGFGGRKCAV